MTPAWSHQTDQTKLLQPAKHMLLNEYIYGVPLSESASVDNIDMADMTGFTLQTVGTLKPRVSSFPAL